MLSALPPSMPLWVALLIAMVSGAAGIVTAGSLALSRRSKSQSARDAGCREALTAATGEITKLLGIISQEREEKERIYRDMREVRGRLAELERVQKGDCQPRIQRLERELDLPDEMD